jgi:two-component sensor histidine kinase/integral membrane sensor domain MASE1
VFPPGLVLFVLAYLAAALLGCLDAAEPPRLPGYWLCGGVYLAALLRTPVRHWPVLVGVVLVIHLLLQYTEPLLALSLGLGKTVEAVLAACLLRPVSRAPGLSHVGRDFAGATLKEVAGLVLIAVPSGTAAGAACSALARTLAHGGDLGMRWLSEWVSALLGAVVATPVLLAVSQPRSASPRPSPWGRKLEASALAGGLAAVTLFVFAFPASSVLSRTYPVFPFLLWAALRFGLRGAALANLLHTVVGVWYGARDKGPFAVLTEAPAIQILALQLYLIVVSASFLMMAAVMGERLARERQLREALRFTNAIFELSPVPMQVFDRQGVSLRFNEAQRAWLGLPNTHFGVGEFNALTSPFLKALGVTELFARAYRGDTVAVEGVRLDLKEVAERWHGTGGVTYADLLIYPVHGEAGTVEAVVAFARDVSERIQAQAEVLATLAEKETLLKEVHHRVKNNLAVIMSLLSLQEAKATDPATRELLRESQNRVRSMVVVHETLFQSRQLSHIEVKPYIEQLCRQLFSSYGLASGRITFEDDVAPLGLSLDRAIPFGLVLNELVSNALKHAFPGGRAGRLRVQLAWEGQAPAGEGEAPAEAGRRAVLVVADNGVGLAGVIGLFRTRSLGLRLVANLTRQLDGILEVQRQEGTTFRITFTPKVPGAPS